MYNLKIIFSESIKFLWQNLILLPIGFVFYWHFSTTIWCVRTSCFLGNYFVTFIMMATVGVLGLILLFIARKKILQDASKDFWSYWALQSIFVICVIVLSLVLPNLYTYSAVVVGVEVVSIWATLIVFLPFIIVPIFYKLKDSKIFVKASFTQILLVFGLIFALIFAYNSNTEIRIKRSNYNQLMKNCETKLEQNMQKINQVLTLKKTIFDIEFSYQRKSPRTQICDNRNAFESASKGGNQNPEPSFIENNYQEDFDLVGKQGDQIVVFVENNYKLWKLLDSSIEQINLDFEDMVTNFKIFEDEKAKYLVQKNIKSGTTQSLCLGQNLETIAEYGCNVKFLPKK